MGWGGHTLVPRLLATPAWWMASRRPGLSKLPQGQTHCLAHSTLEHRCAQSLYSFAIGLHAANLCEAEALASGKGMSSCILMPVAAAACPTLYCNLASSCPGTRMSLVLLGLWQERSTSRTTSQMYSGSTAEAGTTRMSCKDPASLFGNHLPCGTGPAFEPLAGGA